MKDRYDPERRKLSFGSKFMLILVTAVLAGSALVIGKLSSGASVDLSKLDMKVIDIRDNPSGETAGRKTGNRDQTRPESR